jgi:predicted metal-binding protein
MTEYRTFKCNRCNIEQCIKLEIDKEGWSFLTVKVRSFSPDVTTSYLALKDNESADNISACDLDLCPACLDTFKAWYNNKNK